MMYQGTVGGFPMGERAALVSRWGEYGGPRIGNRSGAPNSFEDMHAMFPTDTALATYIQGGMGGPVALPEITGNSLRDMIYFIRTQTQGGFGTAPGLDDPNYVPPLFLSLS